MRGDYFLVLRRLSLWLYKQEGGDYDSHRCKNRKIRQTSLMHSLNIFYHLNGNEACKWGARYFTIVKTYFNDGQSPGTL